MVIHLPRQDSEEGKEVPRESLWLVNRLRVRLLAG
jgi:hypothetical protein